MLPSLVPLLARAEASDIGSPFSLTACRPEIAVRVSKRVTAISLPLVTLGGHTFPSFLLPRSPLSPLSPLYLSRSPQQRVVCCDDPSLVTCLRPLPLPLPLNRVLSSKSCTRLVWTLAYKDFKTLTSPKALVHRVNLNLLDCASTVAPLY